MPVNPARVREEALTTEQLVNLLRSEATAIQDGRDVPLAFVCSIAGAVTEWGLANLPRRSSGDPHSTENERMLLHQTLGLINALADIY